MRTDSRGHRRLSLQRVLCRLPLALFYTCFAASAGAAPQADEVAAGRQQLATEVSAVDGLLLRSKMLNSVCKDADCRLAHWYSGEVERDGNWLSLDAVGEEASNDERLLAYRQLRANSADRAADYEKLARWCQKQGLSDLAEVHWLQLLRFAPTHRAALKELQLGWYDGRLLAQDEIEHYRAKQREFRKKTKRWQAKARQLRRAMEQGGADEQLAARQQLRQVREPAAVPALVEEFVKPGATEQQTLDRRTELMEWLGAIDDPLAVETIVNFAIGAPRDAVRYAAIDQLKSKEFHQYVPTLLAEMRMPIEASVSIYEADNQIVSNYSYEQEGPGDQQYERNYRSARTVPGQRYLAAPIYRASRSLVRGAYTIPAHTRPGFQCGGHWVEAQHTPARHVGPTYKTVRQHVDTKYAGAPEYQANKENTVRRSQAEAAGAGRQIAALNRNIQQQNESIADVLTQVTGETLNTFPKTWWNWWGDYLAQNPDLAASGARQHLNAALLNQEARGLSRGTWVWALQGLRAVETVRPGDYVLAQDPSTGELDYKAVLAIAAPRDLAVSKLDFADSAVHCTPGHVVWKSGAGWRRVAKTEDRDTLHGVENEPRLQRRHDAFSIDCYDLVVADFHTFFVGEAGILVHDASLIEPTYVALPGFSPADVAHAARMAATVER